MNKLHQKQVHERFHKKTSAHRKIVKSNNFTYRHILKKIDQYILPHMKVLDIGCGSGTLAFYTANKGNMVVGIDVSQKAINECKASAKNLKLEKYTSFRSMSFPEKIPNEKFDAILLIEVIEHLSNDKLALTKLYKLLKKDGVLILSTPSNNAPLYRLKLTHKFDVRVGHVRRYSLEGLRSLCQKSGFEILEEYKTEGIIRNFLFINPIAGKSVRYIKYIFSDIVTFFDDISCKLFGESDLFLILKK